MSATTLEPAAGVTKRAAQNEPIPTTRLIWVELTKMFDTRSGFWLLASGGIAALLATIAVILFAPDRALTFDSFAAAIGVPLSIVLPMVAILSVTSEWSQRSGLTTFTLVPHRGRVIWAKAVCAVGIGVASILVAFVLGALGNIVGTAIAGVDTVWNVSVSNLGLIVLANVLGLLVGFMLGVLIRNSPGAIVAYFVYSFVLPALFELLANLQGWFDTIRGWVDFHFAQSTLFSGSVSGTEWGHLAVSSIPWLIVPLALGLWLVLRSEVK